MGTRGWLLSFAVLVVPGLPFVAAQEKKGAGAGNVTWKKTVVDKAFRAEGVAVADINKDGKADIFTGDVWYEAPSWKMHVVRADKPFNPSGYSESFACFAHDYPGDGYPDFIVIPFPGKACYWYENPGAKGGKWKEHFLTNSACNETPIYIDLFGKGKVLVMGWQPEKQNNMGEMCWFTPGADPTKPWTRHSISGPSEKGKEIPGTQRFSHGLGHGDVNGDGRVDIIVPQGWWEQPAKVDGSPWKFHRASLGANCADMHVLDVDGDGKNDVISTAAHQTGFWWHQQVKEGFVTREFFPNPLSLAKLPKEHSFTPEEEGLYGAVHAARKSEFRLPWRADANLSKVARDLAKDVASGKKAGPESAYAGKVVARMFFTADEVAKDGLTPAKMAKLLLEKNPKAIAPGLEVGVGVAKSGAGSVYVVLLGDRGHFALPGQTHALHLVDINGDGLKDLVTGRRWWAHGAKGDDAPNDPAYLYWFEARRGPDGITSFVPNLIDDDSGIGTQFAVEDINGDGIPDIIIGNKKGVYVFEQVRTGGGSNPGRKE